MNNIIIILSNVAAILSIVMAFALLIAVRITKAQILQGDQQFLDDLPFLIVGSLMISAVPIMAIFVMSINVNSLWLFAFIQIAFSLIAVFKFLILVSIRCL